MNHNITTPYFLFLHVFYLFRKRKVTSVQGWQFVNSRDHSASEQDCPTVGPTSAGSDWLHPTNQVTEEEVNNSEVGEL